MSALEIDLASIDQRSPDGQELVGDLLTLIVIEMEPITRQLNRIAARNDVDETSPARNPVE